MKMQELHQQEIESDTLECEDELTALLSERQIILYNDDFNTFDTVINSLIKVCKHGVQQAEQCTYLVHYKGKCAVKKGPYNVLEPMCNALLERGLTAEIE